MERQNKDFIIMDTEIKDFFANSKLLDYMVLRPLSHINGNWELTWDSNTQEYQREPDTFAGLLIDLINELSTTPLSDLKYHLNEDKLAEYAKKTLNWDIKKDKNRWVGSDYISILQQGGFMDVEEQCLVQSAIGRIKEAIKRKQLKFDEVEKSHRLILSAILTSILYLRIDLSE